ncbi:hypothetical protein ITX54_20815 [Rouxiella silvae]|uniref:Peptidase S1 domain-containing protein n=1 Tax=Rouxiella silvae TaxID=1646373 RepID=A0AA40X683_9GAMM|nr:hypothetical protein [Rouxiella silvae]MBF6639109.1 hypothetical protein [Rouxiella silvae]
MNINAVFRGMTIAFAAVISINSYALVMNNPTFINNGGHLSNVNNTMEHAYEPLRKESYSARFDAVGKIYSCSSTWLGDSKDGTKSYILAAGHCMDFNSPGEATKAYHGEFRDRHDRLIAKDGVYYTGPYRTHRPEGMGGVSGDIGILVLNKKAPMLDEQGKPLNKPWIYDGSREMDKPVELVGYGNWGVGQAAVRPSDNPNDDFSPQQGSRRAWGQSYINELFEKDYALGAPYHPEQVSKAWARLAPGDSGSAWWQQHNGFWTIIGITKTGVEEASYGVRVSKYVDWIKSIYPDVNTLSQMTTVNEKQTLTLPDFSKDLADSSVTYIVPKQSNATGPTVPDWDLGKGYSEIIVTLSNIKTGHNQSIKLRAWRNVGCANAPMNSATGCGKASPLELKYAEEDNKTLPEGHYKGTFNLLAQGWHDTNYRNNLLLAVDLNIQGHQTDKPLYPIYQQGHHYEAGQIVTAKNGKLYKCKNKPFAKFCSINSAAYSPGRGPAWSVAWIALR